MSEPLSSYTERSHPDLDGGLDSLSRVIKRDLCIALVLFIIAAVLEQVYPHSFLRFLPVVTLCGAMGWFVLRVIRFTRSRRVSLCPDCDAELEILVQEEVHEVVCQHCQLLFLRYETSPDSDRIYETS